MSKHIDYKCTIWCRIKLPDAVNMEELIEEIKKNKDPNNSISNDMDCEWENIFETEEYLFPEENGGGSTIEVYENNKLLYENGN